MSGKLFGKRPAPALVLALAVPATMTTTTTTGRLPARASRRRLWGSLLLALALAPTVACRHRRLVLTPPAAAVENALQAAGFANAFRKLGRAHLRGTARLEVTPDGAPTESVTTETDVWMDDRGNWRLVELNDKDGGREVVLHGRELAVALRYGKMIRRQAEDPEPQRLLQEGVGAPFAAWDLLREVTTVDDFGLDTRAGRVVHVYKATKAPKPRPPARAGDDASDRRAWRRTLVIDSLDGTVMVDEKTGAPLVAELRARYSMRRGAGEGTPMHGAVDVKTSIEEIGQSPMIAEPDAEDFVPRQRTVPEEKSLLGGLPRAARPRGTP